jgi:hypothetical protein
MDEKEYKQIAHCSQADKKMVANFAVLKWLLKWTILSHLTAS